MRALLPDTEKHRSAARRQEQYEKLRAELKNEGADGGNLQARSATLRNAGLEPSAEDTRYGFDTSSCIQIVKEITKDESMYLVRMGFAGGRSHVIATVTSNGATTLFDPNCGEFTVPSDGLGGVFMRLAERYRSAPNNLELLTVATQKMMRGLSRLQRTSPDATARSFIGRCATAAAPTDLPLRISSRRS
ncbi:YopT-type cysteine protease domain-containing protein [Bradyrhizobium sp. CCBAU 11357]|uniref:YopT-type cysteine protease domain-containing protein n=1 Tax=Bradyrhizobium sp. CCBAU 11357 TaxID=1630808 RepID=UPI002304B74B|nr:YopT-type cysteine protease domain-containing protein [Bradyrhizobium sp. CCBAU 11357]